MSGQPAVTGHPRHAIRRWLGRLVVLAALASLLTTASVTSEQAFDMRLWALVGGRDFDWVGWETNALLEEVDWALSGQALAADPAAQQSQVLAYVSREQRLQELETRLEAGSDRPAPPLSPSLAAQPALPDASRVSSWQRQLAVLTPQQAEATPQVERILSAQLSRVLMKQGFTLAGMVWPPVTFRFGRLPTYLVISPRDQIRLYRGIFLQPDLGDAERTRLEHAIEAQLDVSALVDEVGGIGIWPTMVTADASLPDLVDIIAHEWTHTYLFFLPLGWHYADSQDQTTMNETVASMAGAELAGAWLADDYPMLAAALKRPLPPFGSTDRQAEFNRTMRHIRPQVDELLAAGRVSQAESYMEAERQTLVAAGYHIRRLNQAYFAFHGSYATSPASVDPIGTRLRRLRAQSGSLREFLDRVGHMTSRAELMQAVARYP
jgi:hypothetical protein